MSARIDHARISLRLREPLRFGEETSTERRLVLLELRDEAGHVGFGEIAPLPGWHRETLDDVERVLPDVARAFGQSPIEKSRELRRALSSTAAATMPSVLFGVEMAWLGLRALVHGCTPAHLASDAPLPRIEVCGFLDSDPEAVQRQLAAGDFAHHRTIKVKVGRRPLDHERATLRLLLETLNPATRLRLDGNRQLTPTSAAQLLEGIDLSRVEFFEEPLRDPRELPLLHRETGVRIGLDETLRDPGLRGLWHGDGVAAWVLKPALHCGWIGTVEFARRGRARGISCVVSSCHESGLGLWSLACLAAAIQEPDVSAGLGTDALLAEDTIEPRYSSATGSVALADWVASPAPDLWESATRRGARLS